MGVTREFQERIGRIEGLVQKLETASDPVLRRTARELIESLMEIHGAGFDRILEIVSGAGEAGAAVVESLADDELVSSLLVLYGLHPHDFERRVRRGLEKARPLLRSQGVHLELISVGDSIVRVKIIGAENGSAESAVRDALLAAAPDASEIVIEGGQPVRQAHGFVPLASLRGMDGAVVAIANVTQP